MADLEIKTADELGALGLEDRWKTRRAARETDVARWILRIFLDRGGPIPVTEIAATFDGPADVALRALVSLDDDDLIRVRDGMVDIAYPFSASPTPFLVRLPGGEERYACCATDALGIAPMVGQQIDIRSRCHDCGMPLEFSVAQEGPGREADGIMLWIGKRGDDDQCRAADFL